MGYKFQSDQVGCVNENKNNGNFISIYLSYWHG